MEESLKQGLLVLYEKLATMPTSEENLPMMQDLQANIMDCINNYSDEKYKELITKITLTSAVLKETSAAQSAVAMNFAATSDKIMSGLEEMSNQMEDSDKPATVPAMVSHQTSDQDQAKINEILAQIESMKTQQQAQL